MSYPRRILRFPEPGQVEIVQDSIDGPSPDEVLVETVLSAVSPGTERLIYRGEAPDTLSADASIDALTGGFSYPMTYGYAVVGRVAAVGERVDDDWHGQRVFSFHPHASRFTTSPDELVPLPSEVESTDGVVFPNLETAVTLAMDGKPGLGERVIIFGQGVVGLLTTALMSTYPLEVMYAVEPSSNRRALSSEWGADQVFAPGDTEELRSVLNITSGDAVEAGEGSYEGADLVYELSGDPSVLTNALSVAGYDGRVVIGSWYGEKTSPVELGGRFHRSRVQVKSSQVSSIDPDYRGRWSKNRRTQLVLRLLASLRPGKLITAEYSLEEASSVYARLSEGDESLIQPVFRY